MSYQYKWLIALLLNNADDYLTDTYSTLTDMKVHISHVNHNLHIGVIIFPNIDNTQSTDLDQFEANEYEYQKLEVPINLAWHLRWQLYISL